MTNTVTSQKIERAKRDDASGCTSYLIFSLDVREIYKMKYAENPNLKKITDTLKIIAAHWKMIPETIKSQYKRVANYVRSSPMQGLDYKTKEGRIAYKRLVNMPESLDYIPTPSMEVLIAAATSEPSKTNDSII